MLKQGNKLLQRQRRRKRWYQIVGILSCFVVFCTTYALILPAITMERTTYCGKEHTHSPACYIDPDADVETEAAEENSMSAVSGEGTLTTAEGDLKVDTPNDTEATADGIDGDSEILPTDEGDLTGEVTGEAPTEEIAEDLSKGAQETTSGGEQEAASAEERKMPLEDGQEETPAEEQSEESDAIDTYADQGSISAGQSAEIYVGDTITLKGSSGNRNNWSASPAECVTWESSGNNNIVVTGKAAGTVTITHTYSNKGASETFTVVVLDAEDAEQEVSASDPNSSYTVTVKGKKKVLSDGVTLHVEDFDATAEDYEAYYEALKTDLGNTVTSLTDDSFAFLQMYHIYLTKDGQDGEYVPTENVNLQVTITYDTPPDNWSKVNWVGHYKKKNGAVSGEALSDGSSTSTGVKQIKVSGNSITFHIQSFSVFSVAALSTDSGGGSGGGSAVKSDGSILTDEQLSWIGDEHSNEWQIVDGEYAGNTGTDKTLSSDGKVRVQKNVIPTGVENEFLVYLSVDTKQLFADFFASAEYQATTSNDNHSENPGTVKDSMTGDQKNKVSGDGTKYSNSGTFTILSSSGELLAENIKLSWSQAQNVTFYLEVKDGSATKYVLVGVKIKSGSSNTVMLSEEAERLIMSNVAQMADLRQVTDTMGDYVKFLSVVSGDYTEVPSYDESTHTLTWQPTVKENPQIDKVKEGESKEVSFKDYNGNTRTETVYKYTSWALNAAELVYKVRLDVGKKGFLSAADNLKSKVGDPESCQVNASASLTYGTDGEISFPVPYVRGVLYDLQFEKVDSDDTAKRLSGAGFTLTDASGNSYPVEEVSGKEGVYQALDLPWGTYTLTEQSPPTGYQADSSDPGPWEVTVCYTTDRTMTQDVDRTVNMLFTGRNTGDALWQIKNKKVPIYIDLWKTDMTYNYLLEGAGFKLYDVDPSDADAVPMTDFENITVTGGVIADNLQVEDGKTYYLVETRAPEGYLLPKNPIFTLKVNMANTTASGPIAVTGGDGTAKVTTETQTVNGAEVTVYQIRIPNNPGVTLPKTGGIGTYPYTLNGLGLISGAFMYGYTKKRRRNASDKDAARRI